MNMQSNQMMFQMPHPYTNMMAQQQPQVPMFPKNATTLYIGDLDEQINEEYLYQKFCQFGQIFTLKIAKDTNKKSRGFAFITFYNKEDAEKAKIDTNHKILLINRIRVTFKKNIKELQNEANIYVKNLSFNTNVQEFDKFFTQFGQIFSSKLNCTKQGFPGYGYVQFENKDSVQQCLEAQKKNKFSLSGQTIECIPFEKRDNRNAPKTNIYLKNLPEMAESELTRTLTEKCKKFGDITSILVKKDPQIMKAFAFICFSNASQAEQAFEYLTKNNIFDTKDPQDTIYVNWAQTRHERNKKLKDLYNQVQNETNLFLKNLKTSVTKVQLETAFSTFGPVTSCDVRTPNITPDMKQPLVINQFAFVNFANKDDAKNALVGSKYNQQVLAMFDDPKSIFITYHQNKNRLASFQQVRHRNMPNAPMNVPNMNMNQQYMQMMFQQMNQFQQQLGGMQMGGMPGMPQMQPGMPGQQMNMFNPNMRNQGMRNFQGQRNQRQNLPQNNRPVQKQAPQVVQEKVWTVEQLKEKLQEFTAFDQDKQRSILGELLFPKIKSKLVGSTVDIAPKITGMLIDFDVFEVTDIIEFLESDALLLERVQEAEELIKQQ